VAIPPSQQFRDQGFNVGCSDAYELDTCYMSPDTEERVVPVLYTVTLVMPAMHVGYVDVEAASEEEAARLALGERFADVDWDYSDHGDKSRVEILDVEVTLL